MHLQAAAYARELTDDISAVQSLYEPQLSRLFWR
jgi:hypothetical protein